MLRIYGIARTRAFRALWLAEELGLQYEHIPWSATPRAQRWHCARLRIPRFRWK
jgi:Glutathione S-transferase, N-terminal domain